MDTHQIEILIRSLTTAATRRGLLAAVSGGLLAPGSFGFGVDEVDAKRHGKRRRKRKKRKNSRQNPSFPPTNPTTRVDATCADAGLSVLSIANENSRLAQTFTALASGPLVRANLVIAKPGDADDDFVLRLSPVGQSGEVVTPTNDVLAEALVSGASVSNQASTVTFAFATPFVVVAGATYALVLTRRGGSAFAWLEHDGNPCAGAAFMGPNQTGSFIDIGVDFVFTTFVAS